MNVLPIIYPLFTHKNIYPLFITLFLPINLPSIYPLLTLYLTEIFTSDHIIYRRRTKTIAKHIYNINVKAS